MSASYPSSSISTTRFVPDRSTRTSACVASRREASAIASSATTYAAVSSAVSALHLAPSVRRGTSLVDQTPEGRPESCLGEDRGEDPVRELAQLLERGLCLIHSAVESDGKLVFARCLRCRTGDTEVICEREQPLLRTVVEVPLEKAADAVAGLDDAREACRSWSRARSSAWSRSLSTARRGGADLRGPPRDGPTRMNDDRDLPAVANDRCDNLVRPGGRRRDDVAGTVDEALRGTDRVGDFDIGISEIRRRRAKRPSCWRFAELHGELGDGRPRTRYEVRAPTDGDGEQGRSTRADQKERREEVSSALRRIAEQRTGGGSQRGTEKAARDCQGPDDATSAPRARRSPCRKRNDSRRSGEHDQQERLLEQARGPARTHEEDVLGAIAPAVLVEERISEERQAQAG